MTTAPPLTVQTLASLLEHYRLDSMLREAEIILYEFALGKIDAAARDRILDILQFAAERSHLVHEQPTPAYQDEEM